MTNYGLVGGCFFLLVKTIIVLIIFQSKNVSYFIYSSESTAGICKPKNLNTCGKNNLLRWYL